jgi:hypothetical protein
LVVRVEIPPDDVDQGGVAAELGPLQPHDPVIGFVHAAQVSFGGLDARSSPIVGGDVDQRLGPDDRRIRPLLLDSPRRTDRGGHELLLEPAALARADRGEIAVVDRPGEEVDLVHRTDQRRPPADCLLELEGGEREIREALRKILGALVDAIGRAVVEQVPDHLHAGFLGRFEHRQPARPVVLARIPADEVPAHPVAQRRQAKLPACGIILAHVAVVRRRPDEVEANAVAPPVRGAFEPAHEETVEAVPHLSPSGARS